ncbi:heme ABC transporter substrate-binding protein IsdE [Bacillus paranthracis]|uniref:High-affinity heme uptake system protein IsdE n=2 Tax=Bacillus cereus group TaxID=86661 RepID=A0A5M9GY30_9BACI|nr:MULTISPECIES: heme ABC transporter substrate-binding protein IsdE [Bacillus]ACJ82029.1 iron compound ABC transporter, iron compound-binding protein [Bacillus cereus AH187]EJP93448.1 heme ABC transporter, heme-binding protein isdE [Bacillus cereus IS075]EJR10240.1 heme ABC transporter, heme-binding protein isdE [Bacillus cereus MSX-A12]EOO93374.1 heme ABC transporter, heme-binding protein isdE [Bacillus cereus IS845/00]EOO99135.1 heme ABC transporter, heme-binding protein isdE [Bacillus cere
MRVKKIASVLMVIILLMSIAGCSSPKKETAKQVKSESKERIVATTVAVTEIMDALEVELVGVPTSSKTLPKRYKGLPEVGNPMSPDMEKVKSLKPSEVLSVTTLEYELKPVFDGVGMKANFLDLTSLKNMQNSISDLGKKYGREKQAEEVVTKLDKKVASIRKEVKGKKEPTVLILLGVPGSYLVATEHSYIGDLVKQLGGKNIVQGEQVEYLASNTEYLKKADPDIILRAAHGMPDEVVKMFDKEFKTNDIWKHFAAVKNNRVYDLEERLFGTTGNLAAIEALDELKKMMYP